MASTLTRPITRVAATSPIYVDIAWSHVSAASSYVVTHTSASAPSVTLGGFILVLADSPTSYSASTNTVSTRIAGLTPNTAYLIYVRSRLRTDISAPYVLKATTLTLTILTSLPSAENNTNDNTNNPLFDTPPAIYANTAYPMTLTPVGYVFTPASPQEYNFVTCAIGTVPGTSLSTMKSGPRLRIALDGLFGEWDVDAHTRVIKDCVFYVACTVQKLDGSITSTWFNANKPHVPTRDLALGAHCLSPLTPLTVYERVLTFGAAWPVANTTVFARLGITSAGQRGVANIRLLI